MTWISFYQELLFLVNRQPFPDDRLWRTVDRWRKRSRSHARRKTASRPPTADRRTGGTLHNVGFAFARCRWEPTLKEEKWNYWEWKSNIKLRAICHSDDIRRDANARAFGSTFSSTFSPSALSPRLFSEKARAPTSISMQCMMSVTFNTLMLLKLTLESLENCLKRYHQNARRRIDACAIGK